MATISANVTSAEDWQKMVDLAVSKFGGLDTVVNNAGTSYKNKPTLEVTEAEFDKVMAVNVKSIFLSVPAVVPALKNRGGGSIINVASIGAMRPRPGLVWYNASKAAVANVRTKEKLPCCAQRMTFFRPPKVSPPSSAKNKSASTLYVLSSLEPACSRCLSVFRTPRRI